MEGKGTAFVLRAVLLCLTQYFGSQAQILVGPKDLTVLAGSNASFTCTVANGWASISWNVNNVFVVSITPASGSVVTDPQIIVTNNTNGGIAFTSEITIINVNRRNSGKVQCNSLSSQAQEATLSVQVNGSLQILNGSVTVKWNTTTYLACRFLNWFPDPQITWWINDTMASSSWYKTDYVTGSDQSVNGTSVLTITPKTMLTVTCLAKIEMLDAPQATSVNVTVKENISGGSKDNTTTIIIAVTVSVGCLLILVIIILIVVCCRKKKKKRDTSYQSNAWKASSKNSDFLKTTQNGRAGENNLDNVGTTQYWRADENSLDYVRTTQNSRAAENNLDYVRPTQNSRAAENNLDYVRPTQNWRAGENNLAYLPEASISSRSSYSDSNYSRFVVTPKKHTVQQMPNYGRPDTDSKTIRHLTHV